MDMSVKSFTSTFCLLIAMGLLAGCAQRNNEPEVASSASQPGYAKRYPAELSHAKTEFVAQRDAGKELVDKLGEFPDELNDPDWNVVGQVYRHADSEGRSQAYASRFEEAATVNKFFAEEKQALVNRVAGGAQHAAKQKGCDVELYGPTAHGLDKALEKQLEERMRKESEAHALIEREEDALKKANVEPLQKQADKISMTSYVTHIGLVNSHAQLQRLLDESRSVKSTLEDRLEALKAEAEPDNEEIAEVESALGSIDGTVTETEQAVQQAEEEINQLRDAYQKAFEALMDKVEQLAEQQGPSES